IPNRMRERAVAILPMPKLRKHTVLLDPFRAAGLDRFDKIGKATGRVNRCQDVDMIFNPIQPEQMAILIFNDAPDVTEKGFTTSFDQNAFAMFRRKNDVINDLRVGCHNPSPRFIRPLQDRKYFSPNPQVAPAAIYPCYDPPGLKA